MVLPISEVFSYRPVEARTWEAVRERYERDYPETLAALRASIKRHGLVNPVQVDPDRRVVGDGHTRLLAAQDVGISEIPVVWRQAQRYYPDTDDWIWDYRTDRHTYDPPDDPLSSPDQD